MSLHDPTGQAVEAEEFKARAGARPLRLLRVGVGFAFAQPTPTRSLRAGLAPRPLGRFSPSAQRSLRGSFYGRAQSVCAQAACGRSSRRQPKHVPQVARHLPAFLFASGRRWALSLSLRSGLRCCGQQLALLTATVAHRLPPGSALAFRSLAPKKRLSPAFRHCAWARSLKAGSPYLSATALTSSARERGTGARARALRCPRSAPPLGAHKPLGTAVAPGALPIGRAPGFPLLSATAWCYAPARRLGNCRAYLSFSGCRGFMRPCGALPSLPLGLSAVV